MSSAQAHPIETRGGLASMKLTLKFALIMLIPILALVASFWFASEALDKFAERQVKQEAKLVMRAAKAARDYTANEIKPLINSLTSKASASESKQASSTERHKFIKPTVPAYAARRVLDLMLKGDPEFRG